MTLSLKDLVDQRVVSSSTGRIARHLAYLYQEDCDLVTIAAACTITALSAGSVCFDLSHPPGGSSSPPASLDWPDPLHWAEVLSSSAMVAPWDDPLGGALILDGTTVYLHRYFMEQSFVASWIREAHGSQDTSGMDRDLFFSGDYATHREAGLKALSSKLSVVAGGPGTGKTTVVARILATLAQNADRELRAILAAPTGRAAARLDQSVREQLQACSTLEGADFHLTHESGTLHRILGLTPWGKVGRDSSNPLAADVVVVDEASMLSLHMMALLLRAIGESTSVIFMGDPDQLASIEAGAVLADMVAIPDIVPVTYLSTTYRFSGAIAEVADYVRCGLPERALEVLASGSDQIEWINTDADVLTSSSPVLESLKADVIAQQRQLVDDANHGRSQEALAALDHHRLLVAHRYGSSSVNHWTAMIRTWLAEQHLAPANPGQWYAGMPLIITRNDDVLGIYNGDCGVMVDADGLQVAIETGSGISHFSPGLIQSSEPLFASTIHKAQGSQYDAVSVIIPPSATAMLSRQLLYTALTRAKKNLRIIGSADMLARAISSPAMRGSGLASQLKR